MLKFIIECATQTFIGIHNKILFKKIDKLIIEINFNLSKNVLSLAEEEKYVQYTHGGQI